MEDRFKFRAHFPEKKGIMQSKPIHYLKWFKQNELLPELITFETIDGSRANYDKDKIIFMQCTGLKDKNGKLIFEGDICKDRFGNFLVVGWHTELASFGLRSCKWVYTHFFGESCDSEIHLEILGNIYENPEILENNNLQKMQ